MSQWCHTAWYVSEHAISYDMSNDECSCSHNMESVITETSAMSKSMHCIKRNSHEAIVPVNVACL